MIRRAIKNIANFLRLLRGMPQDTTERYTAGNKEIRDAARAAHGIASHGGPGTGVTFGGRPATDKMVGKAIADSHKKHRRQKPQSRGTPFGSA